MTLQQTVTIPADRRLHLDWTLPETASPGAAHVVLTITRIADKKPPKAPNAVTIAAMQEVQDTIDGKIPAAMTIDVSWCKTHEDIKAALQSALDAADEEEDED
jgi:hypothetical protein